LLLSKLTFLRIRHIIQAGFLLWIIFIGIQFGRFVYHFTSKGTAPFVNRPPGVEGFLPIGALGSVKYWFLTGEINQFHPAALVLFITFVMMSLFAKKSFCSWLCPVGTISEWAWIAGKRLTGRNLKLWHWIDIPLRGLKYALLFFFAKLLLLDMPLQALGGFLRSPYWAMSDVKMLHFFTDPSFTAITVVVFFTLLSFFVQNFWCRYLCPYGALLGLFSLLSPLKIRRNKHSCNQCQKCESACPSNLPVARKSVIRSPECTGCLSCVSACNSSTLKMRPHARVPFALHWPVWGFPLIVVGLYLSGVLIGMTTGHWHSSLTYSDYQRLIPQLLHLGF
jgi:polyferredoxin